MNVLFSFCRSLQSNTNFSFTNVILPHLKWIPSGSTFLLNALNDKVKNNIKNFTHKNFSYDERYYRDYHNNLEKYKSWSLSQWYEQVDIDWMERFTDIYLVGNIYNRQFKKRVFKPEKEPLFPLHLPMNYKSNVDFLINTLACCKASKKFNIPIHEYLLDPDELDLSMWNEELKPNNHTLYHGYDIPMYNMHRIDDLSYYYSKQRKYEIEDEKDIDFVFGGGFMEFGERTKEDAEELFNICNSFDKHFLFIRSDMEEVKEIIPDYSMDLISHDGYLNLLQKSRYTCIVPSYNRLIFSIDRFQEAIANNCLPLITSNTYIEDVNKSFDIDLSFLKIHKKLPDREGALEYLKMKMLIPEKFPNFIKNK